MSIFKSKLNKAKEVYEDMTLIVKMCNNPKYNYLDYWGTYWESFWELSKDFPFKVEWYDPDTSYEEDIMARYLAIDEFMQGFRFDLGEQGE